MSRVKTSSRPVELFGLAKAAMVGRSFKMLDQRHEIDAARLEHGALGQVDLVEGHPFQLLPHRRLGAGQEARADAVSHLAEPQIEARGLDLAVLDLGHAGDLARGDQRADRLARQDAGTAKRRSSWPPGCGSILRERLEKLVDVVISGSYTRLSAIGADLVPHGRSSWHLPGLRSP